MKKETEESEQSKLSDIPKGRGDFPWLALAVCLLVALVAFLVIREVEAPWSGRTGKRIFGKEASSMSTLEKYGELIDVYRDPGHDVRKAGKLRLEDWRLVGLRLGSLFALILALGAAATAGWWGRWIRMPDKAPSQEVGKTMIPPWSYWVLVFALGFGTYQRLQTLDNAPFWDEQDNNRRNFHGHIEIDAPDKAPQWNPAGWQGAIWENTRGNNPYFYSVLTQVSYKIWQWASGADESRYNVYAMRAPSVIFGVLAIFAIWWSVNRMGLPLVAPWAALLMSVNALAIEFSVEARGYGVNLFCTSLMMGFAWSVLEQGRARAWIGYGLSLFFALLSYAGSLYFIASINLFIAGVFLWRGWRLELPEAKTGLARWVVTNTAAALAYLWLLSPAFPQAANFYENKFPTGIMGQAWQIGTLLTYASGLCVLYIKEVYEASWSGQSALSWLFSGFWEFTPLAIWSLIFFPLLFVLGVVKIFRTSNGKLLAGLLAVSIASGVMMMVVQPILTPNSLVYFWYIIFILPAVLVITASGIPSLADLLIRKEADKSKRQMVSAVFGVLCLALMFGATSSLFQPSLWKDEFASFSRKPIRNGWLIEPGQIPKSEIIRGDNSWVDYADGYIVMMNDYLGMEKEWAPIRNRPMEDWGKFKGLDMGDVADPEK